MPDAAWSIDSLPDAFGPAAPPPPPKPGKGDRLDTIEHGGRPVVDISRRGTSPEPAKWSIGDLPDYDSKTDVQQPDAGAGQAAVRGAVDTASFGLAPTLTGLQEAGKATPEGRQTEQAMAGVPSEAPGLESSGVALGKMFGEHPDPEVRAAFERGRQKALEEQNASREQHPAAFLAGQFVGAALTPGFGAGTAGTLPARLATGAIAGGVGGGLYGAGEAVSEGGGVPEAIKGAGKGVILGAPTGGILKGAIGPRIPGAAVTAGQKAAQKAEEIGAPLPRGLTDYGKFGQATTAKLQSVPFVGERIAERVKAFNEKAGEHVGDIANEMTGGSTGRSVANVFVKRGLNNVIEGNKKTQNELYNGVRSQIDTDTRYTLPRTDRALNEIMQARAAAHETNPAAGLEQFRSAAGGLTFAGAHRARAAARNPSQFTKTNAGYDAGDFRKLYREMTADLRELVTVAAKGDKAKALAAFQKAETEFGQLADQNEFLDALTQANGAAAIEKLIGAANEKGGNVAILAQLRSKMKPDDFAHIGGTILHELGQAGQNSEFSLTKFTREWKRLSDGAKRAMFTPSQIKDITELTEAGQHVNRSLIQTNRSHTTGALLVFDALRAIGEFSIAASAGAVEPMSGVITGAGFLASHVVTRWLASPSKAAAIRAWGNAYRGVIDNPSNPARIAAFKIATRNLSNNIDVPADKIMGAIQAKSDEQTSSDQK